MNGMTMSLSTPNVDPVDAQADIDAILAKAERYTMASQEQYGNLRMYAVLYKYMEARQAAFEALLNDYAALATDTSTSLLFTPAGAFLSSDWIERREALRRRAEELLNE